MTQSVMRNPHSAAPMNAARAQANKGFAAIALASMAFIGLGLIAAAPAEAQRRPSAAALGWYGTYTYSEAIPRGFGRDRIMGSVDYRLSVNNRGCRLDIEGVMANTHIRCSARVNGQNLVVGFLSFADGSQLNEFGNRQYRSGQSLFTLQRTGPSITTHWQALKPNNDRGRSGRFFRKAR